MNAILDPSTARDISTAINSRSVAAEMVILALQAKPYVHENFLLWTKHHREASQRLIDMGIEVITYAEVI